MGLRPTIRLLGHSPSSETAWRPAFRGRASSRRESRNHLLPADELAFARFLEEMRAFLR